jgi:hypothetical protein
VTNQLPQHLTALRSRLRRTARRRRRPLAAVLAGAGTLVALVSLTSPTAPTTSAEPPPRVSAGQVVVPISLTPPSVVKALTAGDVVDLVGVSQADGPARIVARKARILALPDSGSAFSAISSAVVMVAVDEGAALPLLALSSRDTLTVVIRE